MKKYLYALVFVCLMCSCSWADVEINATNFPDDVFRNALRNYEAATGDADGWFSDDEIAAFTSVTTNDMGIKSLKGIEYFTALERFSCSENELTELDVSSNTKLVSLNCSHNQITTLNLPSSLQQLDCSYNAFAELDLSGAPQLMRLTCNENDNLSRLDLTRSTNLQEIYCMAASYLEELNVSGLTSLVSLDCTYCSMLVSLDVAGCTSLASLSCYNSLTRSGLVSALDLSSCTNLRRLLCASNNIAKLDLSNKPQLFYVDCRHNRITELNVRASNNLYTLNCENNQIAELDLTSCTELENLYCNWNLLNELNISNNRKLVDLYCADNNLTELDLSRNNSLRFVEFAYNQFAALDLNGLLTMSLNFEDVGTQRIGHLVVEHQSDGNTTYPYYMDFTNYMTADQTNNVTASSVKGFDADNAEISTTYTNGIARFAQAPAIVRYSYNTGYGSVSINVAVMETDYLSLSLNNHVYRIYPRGMRWDNAREYCESLGGHLVTVSSSEELALVTELCTRAHNVLGYYWSAFWAGGEKIGYGNTSNRWKWITDEPFTQTVSGDVTNFDSYASEEEIRTRSVAERYYRNLVVRTNGELTPGASIVPYGFICEWEPEATDFAPYSEEYQKYIADPEAYFDEGSFRGAIPEPVDYSHLAANPPVFTASEKAAFSVSALESRYDPRDMGTVSPVRDQTHDYRTCWTFAALGTLETSYIHQGYGTTAPDLSELHMAWYTYMDPRKDYREQIHEKFADQPVLQAGGTSSIAVAFLSRAGVAAENDMPYTDTETLGKLYSNDVLQDNRFPEEYSHPLRIKEAYVLGDITADNRDIVKSLIKQYGAVSAAYDAKEHYDSDKAYYYDSQINSGHAVSIVGWDDNYSRDNFSNMPRTGGAWLAKNSYGTDAGEGGFFWLSYEQRIGGAAVYVAADSKVNKLYGHDMIAAKDTIPHNWSAVILRAQDDETFNEVSFHTRNNNVRYDLYINTFGDRDTEPDTPGSPAQAVASGTIEIAGYHTITLSSPLEVKAGEYFSVLLKLTDATEYGYVSAVEDTGEIRSARTITVAGKSYFADVAANLVPVSSDWKDGKRLYEEGVVRDASCGACIKVFAVSGGTTPNPRDEDKQDDDKQDDDNNNDNGNDDNSSGSSGGGGGGGCELGASAFVMLLLVMVFFRKMLL